MINSVGIGIDITTFGERTSRKTITIVRHTYGISFTGVDRTFTITCPGTTTGSFYLVNDKGDFAYILIDKVEINGVAYIINTIVLISF